MSRGRYLLTLIVPAFVAFVWLSPLSFVPVPWPDDSAFYFVAHELFKWPPRWVMLPQAPFEPTYAIFNFNTMPLYPILIGLGRLVGIDGSYLIKFWPLAAWAVLGVSISLVILRRLPGILVPLLLITPFALDPAIGWASVLVRPESLIAFFGLLLVTGLSFGFPERFKPRKLWDPVAFLLAIAAYAHFNAIHLLFPVVAVFITAPKRLVSIAWKALLYLAPWLLLVLWHFDLFVKQMKTQWSRLSIKNTWLDSFSGALTDLFQQLGNPELWPPIIYWVSLAIWLLIIFAVVILVLTLVQKLILSRKYTTSELEKLAPSAAWVVGAVWLWDSKPEAWFVYYIHVAVWTFAAVLSIWLFQKRRLKLHYLLTGFLVPIITIFLIVDVSHAIKLGKSDSWKWSTYYDFVDCVDNKLTELEAKLKPAEFKVWCPTFPDITIELSRRHPNWQLTRTNDFVEREALALDHGRNVEAVVVTETLGWSERNLSAPAEEYPEIKSIWMTWKPYFLYKLWTEKGWKPNRFICQRGRWQAFMFMKD